jgi:hypothetical protein
VKNVFRMRMLTQMEPSLTDPSTIPKSAKKYSEIPFSDVDSVAHRQLAREAATSSCVLMLNHEHTLPILATDSSVDKRGGNPGVNVAVIGEHTGGEWTSPITDGCYHFNATDKTQCTPFWQVVPSEILGGAYRGTPSHIDSILGSLQQRVKTGSASSLRLAHAPGVGTGCPAPSCDGAACPAFNESCATRNGEINQTARIEAAALAAATADYALLTLVPSHGGESHDRQQIRLPAVQAQLLSAVAATCQSSRRQRLGQSRRDCRLVCVLLGDGSLSDQRVWSACDAVLNAFMPGQGGGEAIVSLLLGERNPSGALSMTVYPENFTDTNDFTDMSFRGRGARFMQEEPVFRFGWSLSYTNWSVAITNVSPRSVNCGDPSVEVTVEVAIQNTGSMVGDHVVLLSLRKKKQGAEGGTVSKIWPVRWLVDFVKVHNVSAGEKRVVLPKVAANEGWLQWIGTAQASGDFELLLGTEDIAPPLTIKCT